MKKTITLFFAAMATIAVVAQTPNYLCFTAEQAMAEVQLQNVGTPDAVALEISMDNLATWSDYSIGSTSYLMNIGDKVYFRAKTTNATFSKDASNYYQFNFNNTQVAASGNIMSLLDNSCLSTTVPAFAFICLFDGRSTLTSAPEFPATTLNESCYRTMFRGTGITTAPILPATTVPEMAYRMMFYNCVNLATPSALPATTLGEGCYYWMYYGTAITAAPALPATTVPRIAYQGLFYNCKSLTTPSALPATVLGDSCYMYMYYATAITTAPALPATELAEGCYMSMFAWCQSLTQGPATLPATTAKENCYRSMFSHCTAMTKAPTLPATTLATRCYFDMFGSCTSLVKAPELPATELALACYRNMFALCTALKSIKVGFSDWYSDLSATHSWMSSVPGDGFTFRCPEGLEQLFGINNIPDGATVSHEDEVPTAVDHIATKTEGEKILLNGQLYILREGRMFDAQGRLVE